MSNTTFDYSIPFTRDVDSFFHPDSGELAKILMAVIMVLFSSAVSIRYIVGEGTKTYQKTLLVATVFIMVCVQYYQLWFAILELPVDFMSNAYRWDCLESTKGGKVSNLEPLELNLYAYHQTSE